MAKAVALMIAVALCALLAVAHANAQPPKETFTVQGKVYCDTCRVLFPTRISTWIEGARVELRCRGQENGTATYTVPGSTNEDGAYSLTVVGDHQDEICDVMVVSSPDDNCMQIVPEIDSSRVTLTVNSGIKSQERFANPIGFLRSQAFPECKEVLDELGFVPLEEDALHHDEEQLAEPPTEE